MEDENLPDILCCMCSAVIKANAANMCISCLKGQVDVTEGITKEVTMYQCRGCLKWQRPPWVAAELESRELLALCLKKINGLNKVKLIDAGWIWTEPHCKRLKLKLTVQKEVMNGAILQQSFIVTFVIRNQQCDECQAVFCNQSWKAVVQVRQKVDHKRTFYFLEQLILKHRAHEKATSIESQPDGVDFFFAERNHALRFADFLQESVPIRIKKAKKLISADNHSNTHNYKFTYLVDIAPVCKDDLVVMPLKLARSLGQMSSLAMISQVASHIQVIDPLTMQRGEIDADKYWRTPFKGIKSSRGLIEFTVLDTTPMQIPTKGGRPVRANRKTRLAEVEIVRNSDFGVNDTKFTAITHLGNLLKAGDTVLGYDLTTSVFNDADLVPLVNAGVEMPDVILVRKLYPRRTHKKKRNWKLKQMEGVEEAQPLRKADQNKAEAEYERFLEELEEDKAMRSQINLYKVDTEQDTVQTQETDGDNEADDDEEAAPSVPLDELLDDLTLKEETAILNSNQASAEFDLELEEL